MNTRPLHENLDTSFVNLAALIKYLRRRQFVGKIRVELRGYEADITLTTENEIRVIERDCVAGRISEGEESLQRLLIRARESGGVIHVHQEIEKVAAPFQNLESTVEKKSALPVIIQPAFETAAKSPYQEINSKHTEGKASILEGNLLEPYSKLRNFPFQLNNNFEAKARPIKLKPSDWQTLLTLTAELLGTIDKSLAEANLDFASAFDKARREISADYPFLNPSSKVFNYQNGQLDVREHLNFKFFAASINELIRRILEKLGRNPKLLNLYRIIKEKIRVLIERRKLLYDKFSITPALGKLITAR